MVRLCFDYGHGGKDSGAIYNCRKESIDNLSIGMEVAERIRMFGVEVDETRTTDEIMGLKERVLFANSGKYDYFISFHRNAFKPEEGSGVETFFYLNGSEKARKLAKRIQDDLVACGFKNRGVKAADFYVLRETKMPAVLVEIGFIDNTLDNTLFDNKRREIIHGISRAIILEVMK